MPRQPSSVVLGFPPSSSLLPAHLPLRTDGKSCQMIEGSFSCAKYRLDVYGNSSHHKATDKHWFKGWIVALEELWTERCRRYWPVCVVVARFLGCVPRSQSLVAWSADRAQHVKCWYWFILLIYFFNCLHLRQLPLLIKFLSAAVCQYRQSGRVVVP